MKKRTFTRYTLYLTAAGVLINFFGAKLALWFKLPLFLDSIGTIAAAALGGALPGICVGFLSNVVNSAADPITLYYGVISVLIAILATLLSQHGVFRSFRQSLLSALGFALIGGGIGSVLTWLLYGFNFGSGISAPLANLIYTEFGMAPFWAQLSADMLLDLGDKLLSVVIVFFLMCALPQSLMSCFRFGEVYERENGQYKPLPSPEYLISAKAYRTSSLRDKVISLILLTSVVLSALSVTISYIIYRDAANDRYVEICRSAVNLMKLEIDADRVLGYLASGVENDEYKEAEARLIRIKNSMPEIEYMYVYRIESDGVYVVFDLDTAELEGDPLGTRLDFDPSFVEFVPQMLSGEEIDPIISNDSFGWLLSVYEPLYNSKGICVAYAAADVSMRNVVSDRYMFVIKIVSLLFGASIMIIAFAIWFAERKLVEPINAMADTAGSLVYTTPEDRAENIRRLDSLSLNTGDEIENLFVALRKNVASMSEYLDIIDDKVRIISQMQHSIIASFANMVESRDENTGGHIKRTAAYVQTLAEELLRNNAYPEVLDAEYVENCVRSAPLHDIGKIKIPDQILSKPGKLTAQEFDIIKTHTTSGREILLAALSGIEGETYLNFAINMAMYHHERWDGRGYPERHCRRSHSAVCAHHVGGGCV